MITIKNILPSKKFFLAIIGIGVCIVLVLVVLQWMSSRGQNAQLREAKKAEDRRALFADTSISDENVNKIIEIQNKDTDGDGLKDWEEGLWGTNPTLVDSNGNGISDFEEVQNRKTSLQRENPVQAAAAEAETEELTPLDIFTRDFYATASLIEQRNIDNSDELIKDVFFQNIAGIQLYSPFDVKNLKLVTESEQTLIAYAIEFKRLTSLYNFDSKELSTVLEIAANTVKNINPDTLPVRNKYQSMAKGLESMQVPAGLADLHTNMINAALLLHSVISSMTIANDDPLTSFSASLQFTDAVTKYSKAYSDIYEYLKKAAGM